MWKKNCFSVARGSEPCLGLTSGWEGGQMFLGSNLAERPRKVTLEAGNSTTVPMGHSALMPGHWWGGGIQAWVIQGRGSRAETHQ